MKLAYVVNNVIIEFYQKPGLVEGWLEVPDSAKVGDLFNLEHGQREEKLATELPSLQELIVTLWESIVSGDTQARDALEAKRQFIKAKYPR